MSEDSDEQYPIIAAEIVIRHVVMPDGQASLDVSAEDGSGEMPPISTILWMMEMGKDSLKMMCAGGDLT